MPDERVFNFNPGPATLPRPVLEQAQQELLNCGGSGMSVLEMSHRSPEFERILDRAEGGLRQHLDIPDDYAILFLQGGASLQFTMVPMNLYLPGRPIDVLHTGHWTKKALEEIDRVAESRLAASTEPDRFRRLPRPDEISLNPGASCVYMCSNNTIFGSQWRFFPDTGGVPLVADMSSDILSRSLDVARFGLIFAGAQKNLGPAGVTIVIIRRDLAERAPVTLPAMLQYRSHIKQRSLYNTPPTFAIYLVALLLDWLANEGGLPAIERRNEAKAGLLYKTIDASGFYHCPVEEAARSRMNVVFRIGDNNEALEQKFAGDAAAAGLVGLKGHRAVGGIRASIYNAQPLAAVQALVEFMREFERENG